MLAEREEKEAAADAGNLMAYNNNIDEGWVKRRLRKCCTTCVTRLAFIREERVHPLYWGRRNINNNGRGGGEREKYVRNRGCLSSHPIRVASYRGKAIPVIRFGKVGR